MKDKIKSFFSKKESYYEPEKNIQKEKHQNKDEEIKHLRKENETLKKSFADFSIEKFKTRRSIRKFSDRKIDWNTIYNIVDAALNSPCAGNLQNSKIIIVENKDKINEIGKLAYQQYWLCEAPVVLIVTRDDYHIRELYPNEGDIYSIQNAAALIENILMLAHIYDLGACWVEALDCETLKESLAVPAEHHIDAIIPIGYPLENPKVAKNPLMQMVFFEKFGNKER